MRLTPLARFGLLAFITVLTITLHIWLAPYIFPTSSLKIHIYWFGAANLAEDFLERGGIEFPGSYQCYISFETRSSEKAYLEQTLGVRQANEVMQSEGFVYYWRVRWSEPGQPEVCSVDVTPDGEIIGYQLSLPQDNAESSSGNAESVARAALRQMAGLDLSEYKLQQSNVTRQMSREDATFVWELKDYSLGQATRRISATVTDNMLTDYRQYLAIPESFSHRYLIEHERGNSLSQAAFTLGAVFYLVALVGILIGLTRHAFQWRSGLVAAVLMTLVWLLNMLNTPSLRAIDFEEMRFWPDFMPAGVEIILQLLYVFTTTLLLVGAAEWFYRQAFPAHRPLAWWFTRAGLGSREGRRRVLLGLWLIPVQLAFLGLFYFLAEHGVHGWMPTETPFNNLFNTSMPWAYALLVGIDAAVSEEFLFRVLAISWLLRVVKKEWLAVLIPALIWGFGHCHYQNQPFYIRGIELTLWGIVFGMVFVRYGPLPSLLAHAGYNAIIMGLWFLSSATSGPQSNFTVVLLFVLLPLILSLWWSRRRPTNTEAELPDDNLALSEQLAEQRRQQDPPLPVPETDPPIPPMSQHAWRIGLALALAGLVVAGLIYVNTDSTNTLPAQQSPANDNPLHGHLIDQQAAVRIAREALAREKANVDGWIMTAATRSGEIPGNSREYLALSLPEDSINKLLEQLPTLRWHWEVVWYQPLGPERWEVCLTAEGAVWYVYHDMPEEAPGAYVSPAQARALAEAALAQRGYRLDRLQLEETQSERLPHRDIFIFTWSIPEFQVRDARFTIDVAVDGGRVNWIEGNVETPDDSSADPPKSTPWKTIGIAVGLLLFAVLIFRGGMIVLAVLREYSIPWNWGFISAGMYTVPTAILLWLMIPWEWDRLTDTVSPVSLLVRILAEKSNLLFIFAAVIAVAVPVAIVLWHEGHPQLPGVRTWLQAVSQPWGYSAAWRHALLAQFPLAGLFVLIVSLVRLTVQGFGPGTISTTAAYTHIPTWLLTVPGLFSSPNPFMDLRICPYLDLAQPLLFLVLAAGITGLVCLLGWLILLAFAKHMFHTRRRALAWLAGFVVIAVLLWETNSTYLFRDIAACLAAVLIVWGVYYLFLRTNPLIFFVSPVTVMLAIITSELIWFPAYRPAAFIIGALLATAYGWALVSAVLAARNAHRRPSPLTTAPPAEECMVADAGQ